jgi:hypothetical protein
MTRRNGKYALLRTLSAAFALQIAAGASAWACDGQVGAVVFEDTFADDSGGWEQMPPENTIKPPYFLAAPDKAATGMASLNLTFTATSGDFCLEAILPPKTAPGGGKGIGIVFYATDYDNFMETEVGSDASIGLWSKKAGKWNTIFKTPSSPAFKAGPGASNALRVVALDGTLTVYLNGVQVKATRTQVPTGDLRFGIMGEFLDSSTAIDGSPPIQVTSFKVTAGK